MYSSLMARSLEIFLRRRRLRRLEVDDEIGGGQLGAEEFVITVVDGKLVVAEVEVGEEFVLLEDVVGDDYLLRIVGGGEGAELLEAADEKGKLSLESGSGLAIIEGGEKWVLLGLLNKLAVELLGKETGERALADANRTFDGDVSGWFEKISHGGVVRDCVLIRLKGSISRGTRWEQQG
jgi:hypothetical protein